MALVVLLIHHCYLRLAGVGFNKIRSLKKKYQFYNVGKHKFWSIFRIGYLSMIRMIHVTMILHKL